MGKNRFTVPIDTDWFDSEPEKFLKLPDFIRYQDISEVDFKDLLSNDEKTVGAAQKELTEQSLILRQIQNQHFGWPFPFFTYTHDFELFRKTIDKEVPRHNPELDMTILAFPMCDSLRRRNNALSHAIIPYVANNIKERRQKAGQPNNPLIAKNLGSGPGLDIQTAMGYVNGDITKVLNYETDIEAIKMGEKITEYFIKEGYLKPGVVTFFQKSMAESSEQSDMVLRIGVICGLSDEFATQLLTADYQHLRSNGALVVSSSNYRMRDYDPLASFLIQRIGSRNKIGNLRPLQGWGLNFRTSEQIKTILKDAGFYEIELYDDVSHVNQDLLNDDIKFGIDVSPSKALRTKHSGKPLRLPSAGEINKHGYNWIAVAWKK